MGFDHCGVAYYDDRNAWAFYGMRERIRYRSFKELLPAYEDALATEQVDTASRLYWATSSEDKRRLAECSRVDSIRLAALRAGAFTYVGGYGYRLAVL